MSDAGPSCPRKIVDATAKIRQDARQMNSRLAFLLACLLSLSAVASAGDKAWIEVRSQHFRVLTDASAGDARHVAHEFEQMRAVLADRDPQFRLEGGAPLLIFAARDEGTAKALEPAVWKGKGVKPAGEFHHAWEKEYVMLRMDRWNEPGFEEVSREVVYHEYTHSILHLNLHWIPIWLDEGLANYYGYTRFQGNRILIGAPPTRPEDMPRQSLIPIETLINVNQGSAYYHDEWKVYQFYAESWALVHFMMWGPGMDRGVRLNKFSGLLQQGMEQKKAFLQAFGSFADMDKALALYVSKMSFTTGVLTNPPQIDDKSFSTRTLTIAETKAQLAAFHLWTHDITDARPLAEQAVHDDPQLGLAHEVMGFADFEDGKDAEALREFTQASTLDPTLALSLFAKNMMSPIATSSAAADQDAFHDSLEKVLNLNPQFAPAYVQLARLAWRRGDLKAAFGLSRRAEQLEPTRAGYHLQSGQFLLHMGKAADAAVFAKYVAERWPGPDHDEAIELWDAIPADQRPDTSALAGASLEKTQVQEAWIKATQIQDTQIVQGRLTEVRCSSAGQSSSERSSRDHSSPDHSSSEPGITFTISHDGKSSRFRRTGPFGAGFSDTIWYGEDHFSFCHHLEGMRAVIHYKPSADANYAGDVAEVDIRDDLPEPPPAPPAAAPAAAQR